MSSECKVSETLKTLCSLWSTVRLSILQPGILFNREEIPYPLPWNVLGSSVGWVLGAATSTEFTKRNVNGKKIGLFLCLMVFNATFNNISVILWRSVVLVEETGEPGENHRPVASHWQTLSHNIVPVALIEIRTHNISGDSHWFNR
jgi:hypothetical protein